MDNPSAVEGGVEEAVSGSAGGRGNKGKASCAECRRSKLKCDRSIPCQSCVRRGCAAICPTGTLAATKGNKVLMAHSQRLTEQVKSQATKIAELEQALAQMQSASAGGAHPLTPMVSADLVDPQSIYDAAVDDVSTSIGSLSVGANGQARYHGETASSEYFQELLEADETEAWQSSDTRYAGLPGELVELVVAFPFGLRDCSYRQQGFTPFLPSRERALALADLYYENVAWMYDPIIRSDFMTTIISPIYGTTGLANPIALHSHRLSVFYGILATGVVYDTHPAAALFQEQYHALARAALSLDPIWQEATSATVQALFVLMRYTYTVDRTSNEYRWLLGGLCTRVGQMIGLQRDSAGWSLDHAEVQRRRNMFWELYTHDAWTSVVNGRPPSMFIQHSDCKFPEEVEEQRKPTGELEMGWHSWKFRYSAHCLSVSVHHVFANRQQSYAALLEMDKKIRQFPLPLHLQSPIQASEAGRSWASNARKAMQQYCALCERESNLLYIHRSSFVQAIREASQNPLAHKYAQSVLATYRSACRLISSLKGLYPIYPVQTSYSWFYWSGIFSSCIILGALVVESPGCTLAPQALDELDSTLPFYEEGSRPCRAPGTLNMLQKLHRRAHAAFVAYHEGAHDPIPPHRRSNKPDELEVLGGLGHIINKSASNSPISLGELSDFGPTASGSSQSSYADMDQFVQDVPPELHHHDMHAAGYGNPNVQDFSTSLPYTQQIFYPSVTQYPYESTRPPVEHYLPPQPSHMHGAYSAMPPPPPPTLPLGPPHPRPGGTFHTAGFNQEEIWRDFIRHLELTKS